MSTEATKSYASKEMTENHAANTSHGHCGESGVWTHKVVRATWYKDALVLSIGLV